MTIWLVVLAVCLFVGVYSYALYPLLLLLGAKLRRAAAVVRTEPAIWPTVSITLPAYNAQETLRPVLEALVRVDYPRGNTPVALTTSYFRGNGLAAAP